MHKTKMIHEILRKATIGVSSPTSQTTHMEILVNGMDESIGKSGEEGLTPD